MMAGSRRTSAGSDLLAPATSRALLAACVVATCRVALASSRLSCSRDASAPTPRPPKAWTGTSPTTAARTSSSRRRPRRSTCSTRSPRRSRTRLSTPALDTCATVHPINVSSGDATRYLTSGEDWPDENERRWPSMWSPASTVWTDRVAAAASPALVGEPESFTHTPVVFGVPETMARALGWPVGRDRHLGLRGAVLRSRRAGGASAKTLWGSFKISKTNPNTSTTGPLDDPHAVLRGIRQDRRT